MDLGDRSIRACISAGERLPTPVKGRFSHADRVMSTTTSRMTLLIGTSSKMNLTSTEATAYLDSESEELVQQALANALRGRTLTCWPSIAIDVKNAGGLYVDKPVVVDGNLMPVATSTRLEGTLVPTQAVPVSQAAWRAEGSRMFIEPRRAVSVDELLHGLGLIERVAAEGIEPRPAQRVPIADREAQVIRHGLAEHLLARIIPAEGKLALATGALIFDRIGDGVELSHCRLISLMAG